VVDLIDRVLSNPDDKNNTAAVAKDVHQLMEGKPLFNY
jgi:hypothetical protein